MPWGCAVDPWTLAGLLLAALASQALEVDAYCFVERVVDGDTFWCRVEELLDASLGLREGESYRVRLADINAPELRPEPEPGALEATRALSSLTLGEAVALDIDDVGVTDRYGRLVAVVIAYHNETHGVNVNKLLVAQGLAKVWEHDNEWILEETPLYIPWEELEESPAREPASSMPGITQLLAVLATVSLLAIALISMILKRRRIAG